MRMTRRKAIQAGVGMAALGFTGAALPFTGADLPVKRTAAIATWNPFPGTIQDVYRLLDRAPVRGTWDFYTCPGDTIKEKYEDLYWTLYRMDGVCGNQGQSWVMTCPELASIFETATGGFNPGYTAGPAGINYVGTINGRWRLYKAHLFPAHKILVGNGPVSGPSRNFGVIDAVNYIV